MPNEIDRQTTLQIPAPQRGGRNATNTAIALNISRMKAFKLFPVMIDSNRIFSRRDSKSDGNHL